jgi:hypothetical protein
VARITDRRPQAKTGEGVLAIMLLVLGLTVAVLILTGELRLSLAS